jgi:ATP-dependent helicase YprA (DUF1998 family)
VSRRRIEERVDEFASEHGGEAFVAAVKQYASELDDEERRILGEVLVERANREGGVDYALVRRIDEPRWRLFGGRRRPREPGRGA